MPDYYKILGVVDTAEDAVIRAAYKALMQIYHPDKFKGDKAEAERRTKEVAEAYSVLSDQATRKAYDEERVTAKPEFDPEDRESYKAGNRAAEEALHAKWELAREYVRGLDRLHAELKAISPELGFTFKLLLIEEKAFDRAVELADSLEIKYLARYFGSNSLVQAFARDLLIRGHHDAAKELNSVVTLLGGSLNASKVISQIRKKYRTEVASKNGPIERAGKSGDCKSKDGVIRSGPNYMASLILVVLLMALLAYLAR